jgi:hypothetical protein
MRTRSSRLRLLVIGAGAWFAACSSTAAKPDNDGSLTACSWPAELGQTDDSSGQCRNAARAVLSCTDAAGAGAVCVTNDASCIASGTDMSNPFTCVNRCNPTEFGLICGTIGPGPEVTPPPSCRSVLITPAGIAYYCCPCGT